MYLNNVTLGGETVFPTARDDTPKDDSWSDCAKGYLAGTAPATEKKLTGGDCLACSMGWVGNSPHAWMHPQGRQLGTIQSVPATVGRYLSPLGDLFHPPSPCPCLALFCLALQ